MNILEIMAAPFAECMVLVAIHTYLGIHVLKRRVIFVDLALAQTAALGTTMGFMFGIMPESGSSLLFSIVFATIGAAIFALTRMKNDVVPQEAIIGLFYAVCAALAILVIQKTSGAEHIDDILVGSILWARWDDVGIAAVAYFAVGVVHFLFRKQFMLISESPKKAYEAGLNIQFWDFIFYLTFGFVISFSVRIAGVLLVFVFLVAPAIMAFLLTPKLKYQLIIGWATGTLVTVMGLTVSYYVDLPSGPTVIALYGFVLVLQGVGLYIVRAPAKIAAARNVVLCVGATILLSLGVYYLGIWLSNGEETENTRLAEAAVSLRTENLKVEHERINAVEKHITELDPWLTKYLSQEQMSAYAYCADSLERLEYINTLPLKSTQRAALVISFLADSDTPVFFRMQALEIVKSLSRNNFEYDIDSCDNIEAIEKMKKALLQ
ncbi:MAG: metal ABC transporter permease [Deltaproteobacteria bacterium]|nr:metal ABC transporter permease [Deltaproteobacteria bacterium]